MLVKASAMSSAEFATFHPVVSGFRLHGLQWACIALLASTATAISAQTPARAHNTITHRVTQGDTLEQLARRYLGDASLWTALQSHNHIPSPYRLQPGSALEIPLRFMRAATASVDYVQGNVRLNRSGTAAALNQGVPLQEGDQIQLDPDAFVSVRLADGSTVRVQASSKVQLSQLRRRGRAGSLQSVLDVQQGAVEVQVPGKPDAHRRLDVITPVAAASVRGTVFDVQLTEDGKATTSVLQGRVAVQSLANAASTASAALLQKNMGIAVTADGEIGNPTRLLPAASATELPTLSQDAQWLNLSMPAWPQAQGWRVSVSSDAQGAHVLRNGQFQGALARFAAIPDGNYYLHARAIDTQGISGLPSTTQLRVKAHPVAPLIQVPAPDGVLAQGEAQLRCTVVNGATSYRHQVIAASQEPAGITSASFEHPLIQHESTDQCQLDLQHLPVGQYAWRAASVRLVDGQVDQGPFSAVHHFRIASRPAPPLLNDIQVQSQGDAVTIHWKAEPGQHFRLQAFNTPDSNHPSIDTLLDTPQWTATGLPSGTWYIRIQAQDASGLESAFSPPRSVQVLPLVRDSYGAPVHTGTGLGLEHI